VLTRRGQYDRVKTQLEGEGERAVGLEIELSIVYRLFRCRDDEMESGRNSGRRRLRPRDEVREMGVR